MTRDVGVGAGGVAVLTCALAVAMVWGGPAITHSATLSTAYLLAAVVDIMLALAVVSDCVTGGPR